MLKQRRSATPIQPKRIALRSKQSFDKSGGSTPSDFNQVSLIGSGKISQISQCSVWSFAAGTFDLVSRMEHFQNTHRVGVAQTS